MRRSASEIIRELEVRLDRLEKQSSKRASNWKSSSVYIYDESREGFQSHWIATDETRDVKSALNRIGLEIVSEDVFNHVLGNKQHHRPYSIHIYELGESVFGLSHMKAEQKRTDLLYSIENQISGENPYNKRTQQKISEIIYGKLDEDDVTKIERDLGILM